MKCVWSSRRLTCFYLRHAFGAFFPIYVCYITSKMNSTYPCEILPALLKGLWCVHSQKRFVNVFPLNQIRTIPDMLVKLRSTYLKRTCDRILIHFQTVFSLVFLCCCCCCCCCFLQWNIWNSPNTTVNFKISFNLNVKSRPRKVMEIQIILNGLWTFYSLFL